VHGWDTSLDKYLILHTHNVRTAHTTALQKVVLLLDTRDQQKSNKNKGKQSYLMKFE
jgi:hypothetical protein